MACADLYIYLIFLWAFSFHAVTSALVQPATEGVEVRNSVQAPGTFFVVMVSFVVVLFGFIFSFNLWFVSFIVVFWGQCIVPLNAVL